LILAEAFGRDIKDFENNKDVYYLSGLVELVHNGSLMIDDLQDKSKNRRGQPCTYIKYGVDVASNTSTFLYFAPLLRIEEFIKEKPKRAKVLNIYNEEMVNLMLG
jgi:geranylgeranyl pyrophosphate synthase